MAPSRPDRIRVLRIIGRLNVGGPAWQVTTLSERLDTTRFEQRLLAGHVSPGETDYVELRSPNAVVRRIDGLGRSVRPLADLRAFVALVREIREFRPHVVHTHTAKAGVLGRLAARMLGVPVIIHTFHGHVLSGYFSPQVTRAIVLVERGLAKVSTHLVAVGEQVRDDLLAARIGTAGQFTVIPPGVDLPSAPSPAEARRALGVPVDHLVVTIAARLTAIKRVDRFLEAARILKDRRDVTFVVAGGGELLQELIDLARDLPAVRFLGWRSDIEAVYAASDLVVLTSDNEGMPVSLIEAGLSGCATVTTDVGSAREVVRHGETGLVVQPDAESVAAAIARLLDDEELRHHLGEAARSNVSARYRAQHLVDSTACLYESLALGARS